MTSMQIDEATRQATAPTTEVDERISSRTGVGAEVGTAACGRREAEGLRQMDAVVERSNLWRAYERVMRNKGAAGVDGLTVFEFKAWLQQHWPSVKEALLAGEYVPAAIRKVEITQAQWRGTHTGHTDGTGPPDPAGAAASSATRIRA